MIRSYNFFLLSGTPSLGNPLAVVITGIQWKCLLRLANNALRQPCEGDGPGFELLIYRNTV